MNYCVHIVLFYFIVILQCIALLNILSSFQIYNSKILLDNNNIGKNKVTLRIPTIASHGKDITDYSINIHIYYYMFHLFHMAVISH